MAANIAVIGLGNLGRLLVRELTLAGAEVLAIDSDMDTVEAVKDEAAVAVRLDATDRRALQEHGLHEMDAVVVTIGDDFEALILTIQELMLLGVSNIYARATTETRKRILERLGVMNILTPEEDAARRLARRLVRPQLRDYLELSDEYQIVEVESPNRIVGRRLGDLDLIRRFHITIVTIRRTVSGKSVILGVPTAETVIEPGDVLLVLGKPNDIDRFIDRNR